MKDRLRELWDKLRSSPFPRLGARVGDFPFWDSLLAGTVYSYVEQGRVPVAGRVPGPDEGTLEAVALLRQKAALTEDERLFLERFELMEEARALLERVARSARRGRGHRGKSPADAG